MLTNDPLYSTIAIAENRQFQIKRFTRKNRDLWHIKNHYHDIYEIVLYEEIHGSVYLNGEKNEINRTKFLYLPPFAVHGFDLEPKTNVYIVLHISPLFMRSGDIPLPAYPTLLDVDDRNHDMISRLMLWGREENYPSVIQEEAVRMILLWIMEQSSEPTALFKKDSRRFTPLLKHINENKVYQIGTREAAGLCNMSRSSFCDHFKKQFGISFNHFLQEKRIEEARHLLLNSDKNCTEIAAELGFSDASHFTKLFRRYSGLSPRDFRKRDQVDI